MLTQELIKLDAIAEQLRGGGDEERFWGLSTSSQLYVALAANRADLLEACDYTVAGALGRIGEDWTSALVRRWEYR